MSKNKKRSPHARVGISRKLDSAFEILESPVADYSMTGQVGKSFGELSGFNPLFDVIIEKYGMRTAAVYGRIWRLCQGSDEVCFESVVNMQKNLKLTRPTIHKALSILVEAGEIFKIKRKGKESYYTVKRTLPRSSKAFDDTCKNSLHVNSDEHVKNLYTTCKKSLGVKDLKKELRYLTPKDKRKYRNQIKRHFDKGPTRNKRLDDYFHELKAALERNDPVDELPEKPVFDDEK